MRSNLIIIDFENQEQVNEFLKHLELYSHGKKGNDLPWNVHEFGPEGRRFLTWTNINNIITVTEKLGYYDYSGFTKKVKFVGEENEKNP